MVNQQCRRFTNEAANYNALGGAFDQLDPGTFEYINQPCWLVFDGNHARRYGCVGAPAGKPVQDWVARCDTVRGLAGGCPSSAREDCHAVERAGRRRVGSRFPPWESAYDGCVGDRSGYRGWLPRWAVDSPPYCAVQVHGSILGTKGGARTNGDAVVLGVDGDEMPGRYAAGNAMAASTGWSTAVPAERSVPRWSSDIKQAPMRPETPAPESLRRSVVGKLGLLAGFPSISGFGQRSTRTTYEVATITLSFARFANLPDHSRRVS